MKYYHYTDVQAVHSILSHRRLWLTDLRFMNDANELMEGIRYLQEHIANPLVGLWHDEAYFDNAVAFIKTALSEFERSFKTEAPIFALSLSSASDRLSQWRGYGSYCVAFDSDVLAQHGLIVKQCIYHPRDKAARAAGAIVDAVATVSREFKASGGELTIKSIDQFLGLIDLAATFKHEGFEEEGEVRILMKQGKDPVQYRARGSMLIPYIAVDVPIEAISGVTIGPIRDSELAHASMMMFAEQVEQRARFADMHPMYGLDVETSKVPFRA